VPFGLGEGVSLRRHDGEGKKKKIRWRTLALGGVVGNQGKGRGDGGKEREKKEWGKRRR
jgi:hypothetical protein